MNAPRLHLYFLGLTLVLFTSLACAQSPSQLVELQPLTYPHALRNPLKGLTTRGLDADHPWATLAHDYLRWNQLENDESDTLQHILDVCDQRWSRLPEKNVKVIPRVYLQWSRDDQAYWPADMQRGDYSSEQFQARLLRLIKRLGKAWDDDPRVAFVELGIFGKWGEQHSPTPTEAMQKIAADAFAEALPSKKISVRHAWNEFKSQAFGEYWDSFAHLDQMQSHGKPLAELNRKSHLYRMNYIGGETAYDWGNWKEQPGPNPTASVAVPKHCNFVLNPIRWTHCTQLRWIGDYDRTNENARQGADQLQQALGYRFVPTRVAFSPKIEDGQMRVEVTIRNDGSAPFYYNWPIEFSLLNAADRSVVWKSTVAGVDIRTWLPGDGWTEPAFSDDTSGPPQNRVVWPQQGCRWEVAPKEHTFAAHLDIDVDLDEEQYILAMAILDPAGMLPSLRLATSQYFHGGRHPLGMVTRGPQGGGALPADMQFDDPTIDRSLGYEGR